MVVVGEWNGHVGVASSLFGAPAIGVSPRN